MDRRFLLIVAGFLVGAALGYYIGFDHGWEGAQQAVLEAQVNSVTNAAETMSRLIGNWRSVQDPKFTREIFNDGTVVDRYDGREPQSRGRWAVFTKDIPDQSYTGPLEDGAVYLGVVLSESDRFYFRVSRVTGAELELVFLDKGGVLTFERVQ